MLQPINCIATLLQSWPSKQFMSPLPPLKTIGNRSFSVWPDQALIRNMPNKFLIDIEKCNKNANFLIYSKEAFDKQCSADAFYTIDDIVNDGQRISFIFKRSFETFANGTAAVFGKLYDVIGENILYDNKEPAFIASQDCSINEGFKDFLKNSTEMVLKYPLTHSPPLEVLDLSQQNPKNSGDNDEGTFSLWTLGFLSIMATFLMISTVMKSTSSEQSTSNEEESDVKVVLTGEDG